MDAQIVLFDGFDPLDVIAPFEVLVAGSDAVPARVVDDGDLVTAAGVTSGLDLALHLLDRGYGPRIANAVESLFAYERRGTVWSNRGHVPVPA